MTHNSKNFAFSHRLRPPPGEENVASSSAASVLPPSPSPSLWIECGRGRKVSGDEKKLSKIPPFPSRK